MSVNEVVYNGETLIDLKNDTVTPETLAEGATAHDASGAIITGTATPVTLVQNTGNSQTAVMSQRAVNDALNGISLGIASDGLIYIFVNGMPVGAGIPQNAGESGDVFGYVDENNTVVLTGVLADGTYNIKYEMDDGSTVDIGDLVLDSNVYYSVTNTLTNCTNSNSALSVVEGESYSATISADDGYELSSVVVTMGGTDISASAVSGGTISIASVTGNIVITAVAEEAAVEIVNQIPLSIDTDGAIYNSIGYKTNTRIRGTGEIQESYTGVSATGFITAKSGDVVYLKGITIESSGLSKVHPYDANKNTCGDDSIIYSSVFTDEGNGVYSCTLTNANTAFIRVASKHIMDGTEIVTINQPIV